MPAIRGQFTFITEPDIAQYFKPASQVTLNALGVQYGFPFYGIFIAGSGSCPDFILERHSFPAQTGAPAQRADKLQIAIDTMLEDTLRSTVEVTDRWFWAKTHFWNYRNDSLYTQRFQGVGDYNIYLSDDTPPANWWQGM
jgi:hypothetical protein